VFAATKAIGRSRRARLADLLIASNAAANRLPLYTRNPDDFVGLEKIVIVIAV
jgi:predicted nucleic acid-binding protein